ncbi:MAG TPA: hypothetical protein VL172_11015, partial [Kofleriaceae bacterium]|nr:hypothetical protein [Kofleriaceae bacterium]
MLTLAILGAAWCGFEVPVAARPDQSPLRPPASRATDSSRVVFGFGMGAGRLYCEDCPPLRGIEGEAHVGTWIDRGAALVYDVGLWMGSDGVLST